MYGKLKYTLMSFLFKRVTLAVYIIQKKGNESNFFFFLMSNTPGITISASMQDKGLKKLRA